MTIVKIGITVLFTIVCNAMQQPLAAPAVSVRQAIIGHGLPISSISLSPDGHHVLTTANDLVALLWDLQKSPLSCESLSGHTNKVTLGAFSFDGAYAVTGSDDTRVRLWDMSTSPTTCKQVLGSGGKIISLHFSANSRYLLVGSHSQKIYVWDLSQSPCTCREIDNKSGIVDAVAFRYTGTHVVTGGQCLAKLWDVTRQPAACLRGYFQGCGAHIVAFSPDGKLIIIVTCGKTPILLWEILFPVKKYQIVQADNRGNRIVAVAFSQDSRYLLSTDGIYARLWDLSKSPFSFKVLKGHTGRVKVVAFCRTGCHALTGSEDTTARLWYLKNDPPTCDTLITHTGAITAVTFAATGCSFLTASKDGNAFLWDPVSP